MPPITASDTAVPAPILHHKYRRSEALGNEITELCGYINAATHQLLEKVRVFDEEGLWQLGGLNSCAHWLNWKCGIGMNAAREKVRVANALAGLPKIDRSFSLGEISYSKVRAMTRVATTENEDYLLMIAKHGTAHHVEMLVQKYRRAKRLQITNESHVERSLDVIYDADGSMLIQARLPAEQGAMVLKAIELAMERDLISNDDDAERRSGLDTEDQSASTLMRCANNAGGSHPSERSDEENNSDANLTAETRDTLPIRRADALAGMAESYLADGPQSSSSSDRYQVVVHVTAETLAGNGNGMSYVEDGPHVTAETSRRLCCDAGISVLKEDGNGEPLNIGRKSRIIPPAMRRALRSRDQGCRFPGCTNKRHIDGHHIQHWCQGGETSLANLVLLCRHHHRLVHEGGFSCRKNKAGKIEFRNPEGRRIDRTGYVPALSPEITISERLRERYEDLHIDAQTSVTHYDGGEIDWDMAVSALFH